MATKPPTRWCLRRSSTFPRCFCFFLQINEPPHGNPSKGRTAIPLINRWHGLGFTGFTHHESSDFSPNGKKTHGFPDHPDLKGFHIDGVLPRSFDHGKCGMSEWCLIHCNLGIRANNSILSLLDLVSPILYHGRFINLARSIRLLLEIADDEKGMKQLAI